MAKNKIQGLTIQIGGDTTELSQALKEPNKEINDLQSKLRSVEQALKMDPTNTDLLSQKQRLLSEAIGKTEDKLNLLKKVQEEFIESGQDVDSDNYIELERQIALTEKSLKNLKDQQDTISSSAKKMNAELKKVSDGLAKASDKTKGLSTAAGGLLGAMTASIPATQELREDLSKLDLNAQEAGEGIDSAREAFKQFNSVSGETDSSIEAVSNLLQANFTESNLQKAVEGLNGAVLRFPDTLKIESLADSLQETIASGKATGQFAELLDRLGYGAENFSEQMKNCSTEAEKQQLALNILADNGLNETYELWKSNNEELIRNKEASLEMQEAMAELAEILLPIISQITEAVTNLVSWFTSLSPTIQNIILVILALTAALSPMLSLMSNGLNVVTTLLPHLSKLTPLFSTMTSVISTVGSTIKTVLIGAFNAILAHPIIAGITAIIAIIVALYNKCEWFRNAVNEVLNGVWNIVKNIFNNIKNLITKIVPETISNIVNWFAKLPSKIWTTLVNVVSKIKIWGSNLYSAGLSAAKQLVQSVVNGVASLPNKILNIGQNLVRGLWNGISQMGGWLWNRITGWANDILGSISSFFGIHSPSTVMEDYVGKNLVAGMGEGVIRNAKMVLNPMKSLVNDMTSTLSPNIDSEVTKALNYNGTVTVEVPMQIDLDGKPIYQNVVRRITKNQNYNLAFQGG